ncbi:MAG: hypothetical protein A3J08_00665 [Candidatus Lloydbacteria bacterium RIFCSPLOWO2_02_FULL_51_11]|nr:MAG: hypothetical protein A3J08_00665 [Candidatus Lloydbacteria bacterium RIFCSPLOWO2_02_FULL_51_11]
MTRVIGLDFDDVLFDFNAGLCGFHNKRYGTSLVKEKITSYLLGDIWGCDLEESVRRINEFYRAPEHAATQPVAGAVEVVGELWRDNRLVVITSRPESVRRETLAWLERWFPFLVGNVHFATHFFHKEGSETKGEICRTLGVDIFVDDAPFHMEDISSVVSQVFLFDAPWNQGYTPTSPTIRRVRSWSEIRAFFASQT